MLQVSSQAVLGPDVAIGRPTLTVCLEPSRKASGLFATWLIADAFRHGEPHSMNHGDSSGLVEQPSA